MTKIACGYSAILACLALVPAAAGQVLDGSCTAKVNGQVVKVNPDGTFQVSNIPAGSELVRVEVTCQQSGQTFYGQTSFFEVQDGQTFSIGDIVLSPNPPSDVAGLTAQAQNPALTVIGQTTQMSVTAFLADGSTDDVTGPPELKGTTYTSSNPAVVFVNGNGQVTAFGAGSAFVTARNQGATAVAEVHVSPGDPLTNVTGFVQLEDGTPVVGAGVDIFKFGLSAQTQIGGVFTIVDVPALLGDISVSVASSELFGGVTGIDPVPGGFTDAGIIVLSECGFDPDLGTPLFQGDDESDFIGFDSGFVFPYFGVGMIGMNVNSNGNITFDGPDTEYNPGVPSGVINSSRIAPAFVDFNPALGGDVYVKKLAERVVVTWSHVPLYNIGGDNTVQATLFSDGRIVYVYNGLTATGEGDGAGSDTLNIATSASPGGAPALQTADYSGRSPFSSAARTAVLENFTGTNPFDLDFGCIRWEPNGIGGFDVVVFTLETAQETGTVDGSVVNMAGNPIGPVEIEVSSCRVPGWSRRMMTTKAGQYRVSGVPSPGGVEVRVVETSSATGQATVLGEWRGLGIIGSPGGVSTIVVKPVSGSPAKP